MSAAVGAWAAALWQSAAEAEGKLKGPGKTTSRSTPYKSLPGIGNSSKGIFEAGADTICVLSLAVRLPGHDLFSCRV